MHATLSSPHSGGIRLAFEVALGACVFLLQSADRKEAMQILYNESVLEGGVLTRMPGWRTYRPLSDEIRALEQRTELPQAWGGESLERSKAALPIFLTAEIPVKTTRGLFESLENFVFRNDTNVVFVDTTSVEELKARPNMLPWPDSPSPFLNASVSSIKDFARNNFPGHLIRYEAFIILDEITAKDASTCILVDTGTVGHDCKPHDGLLRCEWPMVFLMLQNFEVANMGYYDFTMSSSQGDGVERNFDFGIAGDT
ncbi:hypothetical protein K402DRAFT_394208 [Aulographum hederae CBS 113979]|uniref:Uncharacterized protein n=1 Tax=Aulographum hederae CBS 113979 TaxID=1176131 RepID=A0A6G1GYT9_9PEZI|nr:hypothetical protein K402DRAFT_394208 [Aulographum hederae CBS 113979]